MRFKQFKTKENADLNKTYEQFQHELRAVRKRNADLATRRLAQQHNQEIKEADAADAAQQRIDRLNKQKDLEKVRKKRAEIQKKMNQIKDLEK